MAIHGSARLLIGKDVDAENQKIKEKRQKCRSILMVTYTDRYKYNFEFLYFYFQRISYGSVQRLLQKPYENLCVKMT